MHFGISPAPEIFKSRLDQALGALPGVAGEGSNSEGSHTQP